jgi:hypothetical protein
VRANPTKEHVKQRAPFFIDGNGLSGLNNIINRTQLQHLIKKDDGHFNYNQAHYYLYKTGLTTLEWDINENDEDYLKIDWELAPDAAKNDGIVMNKGQVYAMQFPYCPGCNDGTKWDYWTGKILVLEGDGPQTIEGKNYHETIRTIETASGKAAVLGNSTLATMTPSVYGYHLEQKNGSQKFYGPYGEEDTELISIEPTSGFVMVNSTLKAMPGRKASIDMMTGDVTYEPGDGSENTVTGTPTISGEREMLVYTLAGGLGVVPVVSQQVSIYNASGQLVVSQYLTDEMQFALPAGIYLVRGEKDQVKVMVK